MTQTENELNNPKTDEVSLMDVVLKARMVKRYLLKKKITIIIGCLIGSCLGLIYSFIKKPIYKAQISFTIQDERTGGALSGALGLASQMGFDLGSVDAGGEFSGDNLLELMKSRFVVQRTLMTTIDLNKKKETLFITCLMPTLLNLH